MLSELREIIYHCLKCGACRHGYSVFEPVCPSGIKYGFDSHYAIGRVSLARAVIDGEVSIDTEFMRRVYTCTSCAACDEQCHDAVGVDPLQIIEALKYEGIEKGLVPPQVRDFLKHIQLHGNPYLLPASERGNWARGMGISHYNGQEYLFYVGDVGSYDERGQRMARALASILKKASISFGILGERELSDGNEVNRVGEKGLYEYIAKANIELFKSMGVKKIITLSPHAYNAFRNDYPGWDGKFEVSHYTQFLSNLIKNREIQFKKSTNIRLTFHDPCFLGRHCGEYCAPRDILKSMPGVQLIEMERNKNSALCCGGGGGNFFTDILGSGARSPSRLRVQEAIGIGADILATACPKCFNMLDDAIKAEGFEDRLAVRDLSQFLLERKEDLFS